MVSVTIDRRDGLNSAAAIKGPCRVATTANITLSGLQTVDGVALAEGDRVLCKDQTDARDNGIRIVSTGNWERSADFRNSRDIVTGTQVYITHGTASAERWYGVTAANPISVGTTNLTFAVADVLSQVEAIAAAFPAVSANTMLVDNAAGTARETKTFAQVKTLLDIGAGSAIENRSTDTISPFDPDFGATGVGDDLQALLDTFDAGSAGTKLVVIPRDIEAAGELTINANQTLFGRCGATIFQTARSDIGAFMTNLDGSVSDVASIKSGMFVLNAQISGELLPGPARFVITSGTTTDIVLPVEASSVDDFYTGEILQFETGAAAAGIIRFITDYVGSTRTATLNAALLSAPSPGDTCVIGWNDNAFGGAGYISDAVFFGGDYSGYDTLDQVPAASGGKGWGLDPGSNNILLWGATFRPSGDHMTHAVFVQGLDGTWTNGSVKGATGIRLGGYHAEDCGSVLTIAGVDGTKLPDGDFADSNVIASFITYKNAGHNPYRIVGTDQQKSGIFNPIEAQNFQIYNVSGYNESTYPASVGYPTDSDKRVGYGLGGRVGALIWGHCRNGVIDGWKHSGDLDTIWRVQRGRALGDDASRTDGPTAGTVGNCYNNRFRNIEHFGLLSSVIAIDAVSSIRIPADQLTGELQCVIDDCTVICDANMSTFEGIIIDVTRRSDGKRVRGTPKQIILAGNTFDSFPEPVTILRSGVVYTIADDVVQRIVPPKKSGFMRWCVANGSSGASSNYGQVHYTIQGAATCTICFGPTTLSVGTTVLTDGTADGVDANTNVHAVVSDGIYLKNRTGVSRTYEVFFD